MREGHNRKKLKRKRLLILLTAILLVLLLILGIIVGNSQEDGEKRGIGKVLEKITRDDSGDGTAEDSTEEKDSEEESDGPQELISAEAAQNLVEKTEDGKYVEDDAYTSGNVEVGETAIYSGQYVEDGRDELVENVAAIQVSNKSEKYLELATFIYEIDGYEATFVATGIPAGKTAWVLEKTRMTTATADGFEYKGSTTSFRDDIKTTSKKIKLDVDGNMLKATNKSKKIMENIVVYYKVLHDDGNYLGGITYVVDFGEIKPEESKETLAGHYKEGQAEIVRIDWKEK